MFLCRCKDSQGLAKKYHFYKSYSNNKWNIYRIWKQL